MCTHFAPFPAPCPAYHGVFCRSANGWSVTLPEFQEVLKAMSMGSLVPVSPRVFELTSSILCVAFSDNTILCVLQIGQTGPSVTLSGVPGGAEGDEYGHAWSPVSPRVFELF